MSKAITSAHIDGLLSDGAMTVPGPTSGAPSFDLASIITQLRTSWGGQWENDTYPLYGTNVQYAILTSAPLDASSPENSGWQAMNALMAARAAEAFESWDDLVAISLTQYSGNPPSGASVIQFGYSSTTQDGGTYEFGELGYYQGTNSFGGDAWAITRAEIWMNSNWSTHSTSSALNQSGYGYYGGYGLTTYLHEIGHAMGLSHPGSYNGSATYAVDAEYAQDTRRYTIMSYFDAYEDGSGTDHYGSDGQWRYAQTPMLHDIAAAHAIYGADTTTRAANTTYGFNSTAGKDVYDFTKNTNPIITIYDAGGTDTLDLSGFGGGQYGGQVINLTAGSWSSVGGYMTNNLSIAYGTLIENAIGGSGSDSIIGNSGINTVFLRAINGAASHTFTYNGVQYALTRGQGADTLTGIEQVSDGGQTINVATLGGFDPLAYGASYNDLAFAFRTDGAAAFQHYLNYGFNEGREVAFDANQYLANWGDLRAAFGTNTAAATQHFLVYGVGEHRLADDPLDYVASYADLINVFHGASQQQLIQLGLSHYNAFGYNEQRRNGVDFDVEQYVANYGDIANAFGSNLDAATTHFINNGYVEHRLWENALDYVASFADLSQAFGGQSLQQLTNTALAHFQSFGFNEGRRYGIDFDVDAYLANYSDLRRAFDTGTGTYDELAATYHYITYGFDEGRSDILLV